jgi:hypothetical protein
MCVACCSCSFPFRRRFPDCAKWAKEYFDSYPSTNVEIITLYQAAIAADMANDTRQLSHCFALIYGPK